MNQEKSDERKCWKKQSVTKKGLNKNKKWRLYGWISFVVFHEDRKGFFFKNSKIVEK